MENTRTSSKLVVVVILTILVFLAALIMIVSTTSPPQISVQSPNLQNEYDKELQELMEYIALGYQVDVSYTTSNIVGQGGSDAMKCLNQNGNIHAYSQFGTRFLHLMCVDGDKLYDVTVARIVKETKNWKNPWTQLISAQEVQPPVELTTSADKLAWWLRYLNNKWPGVNVNLRFNPGDIAFFVK